jgi:hypothetical protein
MAPGNTWEWPWLYRPPALLVALLAILLVALIWLSIWLGGPQDCATVTDVRVGHSMLWPAAIGDDRARRRRWALAVYAPQCGCSSRVHEPERKASMAWAIRMPRLRRMTAPTIAENMGRLPHNDTLYQ